MAAASTAAASAATAGTAGRPARVPAKHPVRDAKARLAPVGDWFFSDSWSAALAWFAIAAVLVAVLGWFFILSPYGAPAAPAYAAY